MAKTGQSFTQNKHFANVQMLYLITKAFAHFCFILRETASRFHHVFWMLP